ncbi:MAG: DUF115 domain-containing protein [Nitrospinae bacterium]|nr:DUF115 domain-containing protein [Nitrospinota bacterium]
MNESLREVKSTTILRFQELWRQNFLANQDAVRRNPGVAALKRKLRGVPAILAGAGPSLDKNIACLRQAAGKAAFFASDAAFKPLLEHGVEPAFAVCLDPQDDIARFLTGASHRGTVLVAPSIVHPRILDLWEGSVAFYHKHAPDIPLLVEIQRAVPHIGSLTPGGTVLSVAYDLAFQAGCDPILFVGQDLSYSRTQNYSRASAGAEKTLERTFEDQKENVVFEKDIYGFDKSTLKAMSVSKQWFNWAFANLKRDHPAEIVNCSEAGILSEGCALMTLNEAVYTRCSKPVNVSWTVKKALK